MGAQVGMTVVTASKVAQERQTVKLVAGAMGVALRVEVEITKAVGKLGPGEAMRPRKAMVLGATKR